MKLWITFLYQISLIFADGTFGNSPSGQFQVFYRTSSNRSLRIKPEEITDVQVALDYTSRSGTTETLTLGYELKSSVTNASQS